MFIEMVSLRFRWIVGAGLLALAGVPKRNGRATVARRNFRLRQAYCRQQSLLTLGACTVSRPAEQTQRNEKASRCTLIVAWRCLLKNFVSHQPRRERLTAPRLSAHDGALPFSCKRPSFRFVLCSRYGAKGVVNERVIIARSCICDVRPSLFFARTGTAMKGTFRRENDVRWERSVREYARLPSFDFSLEGWAKDARELTLTSSFDRDWNLLDWMSTIFYVAWVAVI